MVAAAKSMSGLTVAPASSVVLPPARPLVDADEVLEARRLHAREYVAIGYLAPEAIGADGTLSAAADPWFEYSRYFGAFDREGRVRATLRLIGNDAPWPLPTLQLPGIDAAVQERLANLPTGSLGEVSALARDPDVGMAFTRAVFRALWRDTLAGDMTDWLFSVDDLVLRALRGMDRRLFRVIGPPSPAPVRPVLPVWTRPEEVRPSIFTNGLVPPVVIMS